MCDFIARFASDADEATRSQCSSPLSRLWVALQREIQRDDGQVTEGLAGLALADMAAAWAEERTAQAYWLGLDEENGCLSLMRTKPAASRLLLPQPIELHALSIAMEGHAPRCVLVENQSEIALARLPWGDEAALPDQKEAGLPPCAEGQILLDTGSEQLTIEEIEKPRWALAWGRDEDGLYVLMPNPWGEPLRCAYPWPVGAGWSQRFPSPNLVLDDEWFLETEQDWLMLGIDEFGLFASFTVDYGNTQILRYIVPGTFIMGSPRSELGRFDNEGPQHKVGISQGFWLADTACTIGLWWAMMEQRWYHPSISSDHPFDKITSDHPVAEVSWLDIQHFLKKLHLMLAGCTASLPTEAEWEYACRAGTITPFSFGVNINTEKVNFHGDYPYSHVEKGEFRGQTVAVKALAANDWGLYQMHGNVSEWCADPLLDYGGEALDPGLAHALAMAEGGRIDSGVMRVLRGGSWIGHARSARSACRDGRVQDGRSRHVGFRFVLRSGNQAKLPQA
jgi:formylglycine-generating enzyme required for sulfatase activity